MEIKIERVTSWQRVVDAARFTERKDALGHEPSGQFKRHILRSEHSPIRLLEYDIKIYDIPYFSAMHFVRHFIGIEKFVSTQRPDRTHSGKTRHELPQDAPVNVWFSCNAQALINISRVRICNKADATTRNIWLEVCGKISEIDPILYEFLVPSCVAKGFCPEIKPCGYTDTQGYKQLRYDYVEGAK